MVKDFLKISLLISTICLFTNFGFAQKEREIGGLLINDEGEPMPGVIISILGTDKEVYSDINGQFLLITPNDTVYLLLSAVHLKRYVKYNENEDFKKFTLYSLKSKKRTDRKSRKVLKEWNKRKK